VIVVDASALSKYLLKEENWFEVGEYLKKGVLSVDHIVKEVSNAIWKHYVLSKIINKNTAYELFMLLYKFIDHHVLILEPEMNYLKTAFTIATKEEITVYDALYIAQAKKYGKILTSDKRQAEIARKMRIETYLIE